MEGNMGVSGRNLRRAVGGAILIALLTGCATGVKKQTQKDIEKPQVLRLITDISTFDDPESIHVLIMGKPLLTYSAFKQPSPLSVVLFFPETALENVKIQQSVDSDTVGLIQASELTEEGHTTKILISLRKDVPYVVNRENGGLRVSFRKVPIISSAILKQEAKTKKPDILTAKKPDVKGMQDVPMLQSVDTTLFEKGIKITVMADGNIRNYKFFTIENPPRIVLDMFDVKTRYKKEQIVPVDTKWVRKIRYYGYPDKVRLVVETQKTYLSSFQVNPVDRGLTIHVGEDTSAVFEQEKKQEPTFQGKIEESAWVNRIDFLSEEAGKSTVIIGTTAPVKYDLKKSAPKRLTLTLFNTKLPDYRKRPLITTRFESAVDRITPVQTPGKTDISVITMELREPVPYMVEQSENLIQIHFEASSIPPRPLAAAKLSPWEAVVSQTAAEAEVKEVQQPTAKEISPLKKAGQYTGEKIALNFYETDIKNVLRIIREISGENIAIDKDVTGKVTLAFDKPVPWDQVLDLILKMNKLGMVYEDDIIRISRLDTILAEKKKTRELINEEPLRTEYFLISHANANDVMKFLNEIKSERGKLIVDTRTNQIIMTDVQGKIDRAREIVKNVDKVTPQVIIEAKIVEVDTSFKRDIGIEWGLKGGPIFKNFFKGAFKYDVGFKFPVAAPSSVGFTFTKILGTPFDLDVKISALETKGVGKVISRPKITTLNNKKAMIRQGIEHPYLERDESGLATVKFKKIDLLLEVTPRITNDNRISMLIHITKNELAKIVDGVPSISTNEAETEVLVDDGETIVIGGIIKLLRRKDVSGFPILSKIPILGWLFKSQIKTETERELIIFITPRIVRLEQRTAQN